MGPCTVPSGFGGAEGASGLHPPTSLPAFPCRGQLHASLRVPGLRLPLHWTLCHIPEPSALPGSAALPAWLLLP